MSSDVLHVRKLMIHTRPGLVGGGQALRRAITAAFPDISLLHNHADDPRERFRLPRVRYSVLDGVGMLVGIREGIDLIPVVARKLSVLAVGDEAFAVVGTETIDEASPFGWVPEMIRHRFATAWLALNEENHRAFLVADERERGRLLERVLIGNLLSLAQGLDHHVEHRIRVRLGELTPVPCQHKGITMIGFRGEFEATFALPEGLAIGKLASKGYGMLAPAAAGASCRS